MEIWKKLCKKPLNIFITKTYPDSINNIMFLYKWKSKLVKYVIFIKLSMDIIKIVKANLKLIVLRT